VSAAGVGSGKEPFRGSAAGAFGTTVLAAVLGFGRAEAWALAWADAPLASPATRINANEIERFIIYSP
jgi:hypothetical protein